MRNVANRWLGAALATMLALALAFLAAAAPLMPAGPPITDEIRTLARVDKAVLLIELPRTILDTGLTEQTIRERFEPRLREAGVELVDDPDATPFRLHLVGFTNTDDAVPQGIGFCIFLMLEQPVSIERMQGPLQIPTWTGLIAGMVAREHFAAAASKAIDDQIENFIYKSGLANK